MAETAVTDAAEARRFERLALPYRRELLAHCYRMLGSADDAEDLVQETYLRAWRSYAGFEGRSSLRTWLYRIATTACLTALEDRGRRPMPAGLAGPGDVDGPLAAARRDVPWLQPLPDAALAARRDVPEDPATLVALRAGLRLALVAAMQHLPPRQRAVLILRDILAWRAAEVADALDMTTTAVNSALQRARAQLAAAGITEDDVADELDPDARALVDRYVAAFENADVGGLLAVLRDDVTLQMPPIPTWFAGRDAVARFVARACGGRHRGAFTVPVGVNRQAGFAFYVPDGHGGWVGHSIQVVTVRGGGIARVDAFVDTGLFAAVGLPVGVDAGTRAALRDRA